MNTIIFGYIGSSLLILSLFPQVIKTYQTKDVESLSIGFIIMQILTCSFILTYTIFNKDYPIMIANICLLIQFFVLLVMIYKYSKKNKESINNNINNINNINKETQNILRVSQV
jgi:MtN3 and saliva related transmembrane protein